MTKTSVTPADVPPGPLSSAATTVLDITTQVCPMTFVHTRLALDRLAPGETLLVLLRGEEPLRNVPASARVLGHEVLESLTDTDGVTRLLLRRR